MEDLFSNRRAQEGLTYEAYLDRWHERLEASMAGLDRQERRFRYFAKYNRERAAGVAEAYTVTRQLREALSVIDAPQLWMVLTEDWCADSAFNLPVLAAAAAESEHVELRILLRDENLDVMDRYLTDGGRSIPKLVAFDAGGRELFQWGPRPRQAQDIRERLKAEGADAKALTAAVLAFYEEEGWRQVGAELAEVIEEALDPA